MSYLTKPELIQVLTEGLAVNVFLDGYYVETVMLSKTTGGLVNFAGIDCTRFLDNKYSYEATDTNIALNHYLDLVGSDDWGLDWEKI